MDADRLLGEGKRAAVWGRTGEREVPSRRRAVQVVGRWSTARGVVQQKGGGGGAGGMYEPCPRPHLRAPPRRPPCALSHTRGHGGCGPSAGRGGAHPPMPLSTLLPPAPRLPPCPPPPPPPPPLLLQRWRGWHPTMAGTRLPRPAHRGPLVPASARRHRQRRSRARRWGGGACSFRRRRHQRLSPTKKGCGGGGTRLCGPSRSMGEGGGGACSDRSRGGGARPIAGVLLRPHPPPGPRFPPPHLPPLASRLAIPPPICMYKCMPLSSDRHTWSHVRGGLRGGEVRRSPSCPAALLPPRRSCSPPLSSPTGRDSEAGGQGGEVPPPPRPIAPRPSPPPAVLSLICYRKKGHGTIRRLDAAPRLS